MFTFFSVRINFEGGVHTIHRKAVALISGGGGREGQVAKDQLHGLESG